MRDELPGKMAGLNIEDALTRIGIPAAVFKTILCKFAETNGDKAETMRQRLQEGRLDEVALLVHGLKGASGNIGADVLSAAAFAVSTALEDGRDIEEIAKAVELLSTELEVVLGSLAVLQGDSV